MTHKQNSTPPGLERRRAPRYQIDQMIRLEIDREEFVQAQAVNISEQGLYCAVSEPVEVASRVFLLLEPLPTQGPEDTISCEGQILRLEEKMGQWYAAIQLTAIRPEDKEKFKALIEKKSGRK